MKRPLGWRVPLWFLVLCSAAFLGARTVAAEAAVTHPPVRFALRGRCGCSLPPPIAPARARQATCDWVA
jgi:hypothetical protein